ncbi:MAG: TRAP transporter small permease subunit, partial [Thermodesulfobacteriota bacterium]
MTRQAPSTRGLGWPGRLINGLSEGAGYASFAAILGAMTVITYEVMARYLFRWATVWEIEAAVILLILTTFLGSAYALKYEGHVSMDMLEQKLTFNRRNWLKLATSVVAFLFCLFVSLKGWLMWWEAYETGRRSDSLWGPPLWIP